MALGGCPSTDSICLRFKSWVGGQGITEDVVWKNIRLYNVTYPALITQVSFKDYNLMESKLTLSSPRLTSTRTTLVRPESITAA
jgi:hypothetical protein